MGTYSQRQSAQARNTMLRYILVISLTVFVLALLQLCVLGKFRILGVIPDLMLVGVLVFSFFLGRYTGAITGIGAGIFIEALGSTGISLLPVFYLLCGYIAGHYARAVIPKRFTVFLLYFGIALLLRSGITVTYVCLTDSRIHLPSILLHIVLPELFVTAVCGCLLYHPLRLLCLFLEKKAKRAG